MKDKFVTSFNNINIEFDKVSKIYKMGEVEIKALDEVSFGIDKGEFVVILGASGAGKSTILNILGGMDTATSGSVVVDEKDISNATESELTDYRRFDIGFVFQFYNLVQNLTALENVELASQICRDPLDAATAVREVGLDFVEAFDVENSAHVSLCDIAAYLGVKCASGSDVASYHQVQLTNLFL
mgnify:CR=1 FL=1